MTDSARLKSVIAASGLKKTFIAEKLKLSYQGYLKKENGKSDFMAKEISILKDLLKLSNKEVSEIFLS
jgi:DNA-binding XRE family transcriptional regulator